MDWVLWIFQSFNRSSCCRHAIPSIPPGWIKIYFTKQVYNRLKFYRIAAFSTYKSLYTLIIKEYGDIYNGAMCHLPKNVWLAFAGFSFMGSFSPLSFLAKELAFNGLAYPFITVMRRVEAQSNSPGMIPKRYVLSQQFWNYSVSNFRYFHLILQKTPVLL